MQGKKRINSSHTHNTHMNIPTEKQEHEEKQNAGDMPQVKNKRIATKVNQPIAKEK